MDELVFESGEERFGHGVVPADTGPAAGMADVECGEGGVELGGGVVAAAVGVEYCAGCDFVGRGGPADSSRDQRGAVVVVEGVSDDFLE